jgi:hypothetical protein
MKRTVHLGIVVISMSMAATLNAEDARVEREAEKAERVKAILQKQPLKFRRGIGDKSEKFCTGIYNALKTASKKITYIEPVVSTDDPNHPGLERYRSCANYPGPGEWTYDGDMRLLGDKGFRLYRLESDRHRKNGFEEHLYAEIDRSVWNSIAMFSGYQQVNFANCEYGSNLGISAQEALPNSSAIDERLNAVITYGGQHYVYVLGILPKSDIEPIGYWLKVHGYIYSQTKNKFPLACKWSGPFKSLSGE